jgi:hypothetical protein
MKKRTFEIPAEQLAEFAEMLSDRGIENEIDGKTENDEIIINVYYDPGEREFILELIEWCEENIENDVD